MYRRKKCLKVEISKSFSCFVVGSIGHSSGMDKILWSFEVNLFDFGNAFNFNVEG